MNAATNPCTKCSRATRPLPGDWTKLDFFDRTVVEQDAALRASCDAVPDTEKPCLRPAPTPAPVPVPAVPTAAPTLADFDAWVKAEEQRLLDAMDTAVAADDASTYEALHAQFLDLGSTFEVLWKFKTAARTNTNTTTPATNANKKA